MLKDSKKLCIGMVMCRIKPFCSFSQVPRQRCMVHVLRQCLSSITFHPRTPEGRMLKSLIMMWWLSRYKVHLRRAVPNLFEFIKHSGLPKTTNALESVFGHIKNLLRLHRGPSETRVDSFNKWYLNFNDEKKSRKQNDLYIAKNVNYTLTPAF